METLRYVRMAEQATSSVKRQAYLEAAVHIGDALAKYLLGKDLLAADSQSERGFDLLKQAGSPAALETLIVSLCALPAVPEKYDRFLRDAWSRHKELLHPSPKAEAALALAVLQHKLNGDEATAQQVLMLAAHGGNGEAALELGNLSNQRTEAVAWYEMALQFGCRQAALYLGKAYERFDWEKALGYYQLVADEYGLAKVKACQLKTVLTTE